MMVDLSPASRLTRKRNMLLQKQLGVRLQILADEYRMTKKDLEKNSRDLGVFLMYLRDRAPGLSSYGQPDTRAMNAKNILRDREMGTSRKKEDDDDVISLASKTTKSAKKDQRTSSTASSHEDETGENGRSKSPSTRSSKHEFFNKRIVLDSKRRNFLQQCMNKDQGKFQDSRKLGGASTHAGFLSNRDTAGEASTKPRPQTAVLLSERSKTPRYGSDAYSQREENIRQHVLGRFDVIFDPQSIKKVRSRKGTTPSSTPLYLPISSAIPEDSELAMASRPPPIPSGYVLNRRVAWSAPPKRREAPPSAGAGSSDARTAAASRQNLSVTPRSGTANMTNTYQRSNSATCNRTATAMREVEREVDANAITSQNLQSQKRDPHRPKTAPQVYQLMQKSVAAPRQQVAGILAEIQSRRADTRAMLLKSKQLKKMVKSLAPEEKDEDSYSD